MPSAVCHYPWTTLYIEPDGLIYPCCHRKPWPIGQLGTAGLTEVLEGPAAREVRALAADGTLPCFPSCNRAPSRRFHINGQAPYQAPERPRLEEVHLNISTRCNLKCVMCRQDHQDRRTLPVKVLAKAAAWNPGTRLVLQGGEPLVIPESFKIASLAAKQGSPVTLITNGTAWSRKWLNLLASGPHECRISLNGATARTHEQVNRGSSWSRVLDGIRRLAALREKNRARTYITFRMTVVPANVEDLADFVLLARSEGFVNRVAFGYDKKTLPKWIRKNPEAFSRHYNRFIEEVSQTEMLCDAWRLYQLAVTQGIESRPMEFGKKGDLIGLSG